MLAAFSVMSIVPAGPGPLDCGSSQWKLGNAFLKRKCCPDSMRGCLKPVARTG